MIKLSNKGILTLSGVTLWGVLFFIPLMVAVVTVVLPSFGYEPALAETNGSLIGTLTTTYWQQFLTAPRHLASIRLTVIIGLAATVVSLLGAFGIAALFYKYARQLIKWLAVMLALPHAAFALGFAFLIAPAGFLVRVLETGLGLSGLSGFDSPFLFLETGGLALFIVLVLKELPFLTFIVLGSVRNYEVEGILLTLKSLGYKEFAAWRLVIMPLCYRRMRLAFFVVLAYSFSVVDMAIIAGPQQPPTLAVLLVEYYTSGVSELRAFAYTGAIFLGALITASILLMLTLERLLKRLHRLPSGRRSRSWDAWLRLGTWVMCLGGISIAMLSTALNLLWSVSEKWRFPNLLPTTYTLKYWKRALIPETLFGNGSGDPVPIVAAVFDKAWLEMLLHFPLISTLCIGCLSTLAALVASIVFLEAGRFFKDNALFSGLYSTFFIPLLLPETILLFGITFCAIYLSFTENVFTLSWVHFLYTFPYLMLTLRGPYRSYDERYSIVARTLCGRNLKPFLRIKLPILIRTIAVALAIAFSVSVAQYLSTELIGGGRLVTITTEAVNLSAGLNRRVIGVYAMLQLALPLFAFFLVFTVFRPLEHSRARS